MWSGDQTNEAAARTKRWTQNHMTQKPNPAIRRYEGELVVEYDSGEITTVALSATAGGVDVYLSAPSLQLEPAYIGLCRCVRVGVGI